MESYNIILENKKNSYQCIEIELYYRLQIPLKVQYLQLSLSGV